MKKFIDFLKRLFTRKKPDVVAIDEPKQVTVDHVGENKPHRYSGKGGYYKNRGKS